MEGLVQRLVRDELRFRKKLMVLEYARSTGSACTTADLQPSHVLKVLGLGLGHEQALSAVRFGLGRYTTTKEIETVVS